MNLHELRPAEGSTSARKRVGRGSGSGIGKTAGYGHKGQKARSGSKKNGFEGGQMPLPRRLPKRGFHNNFMKVYSVVNIEALNRFENGTVITAELLKAEGIISKSRRTASRFWAVASLHSALLSRRRRYQIQPVKLSLRWAEL